MNPHRRRPSSTAPAIPLDCDDLLAEIFLRLPPNPSSLARASFVCKQWRRVASDPDFLRSFSARHRNPPLLSFFSHDADLNIEFTPTLDSPDRIPGDRFYLRIGDPVNCDLLGCRHGCVLVIDRRRLDFLVWSPLTGDKRHVAFPPAFRGKKRKQHIHKGAIVCAAGDEGHVHGCCHFSPFKVVLLGSGINRFFACLYSSETGAWGDVISILHPPNIMNFSHGCSNVLVGNSVCWLLMGRRSAILEFDLDMQKFVVTDVPLDAFDFGVFRYRYCQFLIAPADGGGLSFLMLSGFDVRVWKRKEICDDATEWVLESTIDLKNLLSLMERVDIETLEILGLAEDNNVMLLLTDGGVVFMVHLESMQFKKLSETMSYRLYHPFTCFYTTGSTCTLKPS